MATLSISNAFAELFSAPLEAVVDAERSYLEIWERRLKVIQATYTVIKTENNKTTYEWKDGEVDLSALVQQHVPVVKLEGRIDTGLTMRIAGVRETKVGVSGGLALGPIHVSGSFGLVSRTSHESVFQASTSFALSNTEFSLLEYLETAKIELVDPEKLNKAIEHLGADRKNLESEDPKPGPPEKLEAKTQPKEKNPAKGSK